MSELEAHDHATSIDDIEGLHYVLVNHEEQHSLWPAGLAVPEGWSRQFGPAPYAECVSFVDENWTDLRPASARV